jgi:hypothetical protein
MTRLAAFGLGCLAGAAGLIGLTWCYVAWDAREAGRART